MVCPICGEGNACVNLGNKDVSRSCWCNDPSITFPEDLLAQIPLAQRRKACVCRSCALKHQENKQVK
ncbi:cysteine-rich CWC family protein [Motilimonas cestriensis]|uniref:Cysteine-rich CWC family protein n=1 Tax=Motilimonas cestriensis TaxID=2742685 RepID=A0ABS8W8L1_9GAMM|nr:MULTISPECIES: cysteine-rich CWC family protein [Motilimonas]MCE0555374.1 cysteine-rich CWC family protein [Motilimonas sp. E26]MCE2594820.1 cysteine-rich CWC family protein [Motilimonas cestriensis]